MKVYISADMEGVTGVTHPDDVIPRRSRYEGFRKLLTADVNAAIEGAAERGSTSVSDSGVSQVAVIAAREVEGVQMGGGSLDGGVGGIIDSVTGGSGNTRGVSVEAGEEEAAVDLALAVEYGKAIPQISEDQF